MHKPRHVSQNNDGCCYFVERCQSMVEKKEKWLAGPMKKPGRIGSERFSSLVVTLFCGDSGWEVEA